MFYGFAAGLIGGAVGLGGAIILLPVWLSIGYDKDVAAASSGPLIFISAFCSFFISAISGFYSMEEFFTFFLLSFFSSWLVKEFVNYVKKRWNLHTIAYILLMFTMGISLVTLLPYQYTKYIKDPAAFMEFGTLC